MPSSNYNVISYLDVLIERVLTLDKENLEPDRQFRF